MSRNQRTMRIECPIAPPLFFLYLNDIEGENDVGWLPSIGLSENTELMHKTASLTLLTTVAITLGLITAALSYPAKSHAQTAAVAPTVHAGEEVFTQRCYACHSVLQDQVRFGPSLYHLMKTPHPRKTPAEVRTILRQGKGKMPSFKDILTPEDSDNLLAYLHTL